MNKLPLSEGLPTLQKKDDSSPEWLVPENNPSGKITVMRALYDTAILWGQLMQAEIDAGEELRDVALTCAQDADTEGRMLVFRPAFHFAVNTALAPWEHNDALRAWYEAQFK